MSRSYKAAIKENLPGVDIVFDRFHIMQLANKAVDKIRKRQASQLDSNGIKTLKGNRYLLLHNYENLGITEKERVDNLLAVNYPLQVAYIMKEELRLFWEFKESQSAREFLVELCLDIIVTVDDYFKQTCSNALDPLKSFAFTLIEHMSGIIAYYDHWITNAKAEGLNNKIKTLKRQRYGCRDREYFKLRLYHLHRQKHRLSG